MSAELSAGLRQTPVRDASERHIATVYGRVLRGWRGRDLEISPEEIKVAFEVTSPEVFEAQVLSGLHGAFCLRTLGPLPHRLYLDAGGSLPIVYSPADGRIASSAGMMFEDAEYQARFLASRHKRLIESEIRGSWIPGMLTAHESLFRLLPNFYLDLKSWTQHRFWPGPEQARLDLGLEEAAQSVARDLQGFVEATVEEFRCVGPALTAGFDSRLVLAASRRVVDRVEFFTMGSKGEGRDQGIAAAMAAELGFQHRLVPVVRSTPVQHAHWNRLVGDTTKEVNREIYPTLFDLPYDVVLTGVYGEVGRIRGYKADADTINDQTPSARMIAGRLTVPFSDREVRAEVERWLSTIDWAPCSVVLDLAFNEVKFAVWGMAQAPVQQAARFTLQPFAQRSIQEMFMRVPPPIQGKAALFTRIAEILWPETMRLGINSYGDYRDRLLFLKKFTQRERLVRLVRERVLAQ